MDRTNTLADGVRAMTRPMVGGCVRVSSLCFPPLGFVLELLFCHEIDSSRASATTDQRKRYGTDKGRTTTPLSRGLRGAAQGFVGGMCVREFPSQTPSSETVGEGLRAI